MKEKTLRLFCHNSRLRFWKNSSTVLTGISVCGVMATAALSVKATPKALQLIKEDSRKKHDGDPHAFSKTEAIASAWKCYIPAAVFGLSTIACIVGANVLNKSRQAAIVSAYALIDNSHKAYKYKLKELYGDDAHNAIVDSIVKEQCKQVHISSASFIANSTLDFGESIEPEIVRTFYDCLSQRYFETTIAKVVEAEYRLNQNFMLAGCVSLNDFYDFLGLEKIDIGDVLGWSSCNGDIYWIDFNHYKIVLEDGMEILVIETIFEPTDDWLDNL